jgi:hypothetical protein
MATEKIDRIISKDAITSFQELKELVDANVTSFEKLIATGVDLNTTIGKTKNFKELNDEITKLKANEEALLAKQKSLADAQETFNKKQQESNVYVSQLEKAKKKLNDSYSDEARALAEVKEQQTAATAANKKSAQETLGLVDAYKRLDNEYKEAARNAQNLTLEFGANSKEAREAIELAQQMDARLKEADYSIGKYGRNVGNYGNALKTLEQYLAAVREQLAATKQTADQSSFSLPSSPAAGAVRGSAATGARAGASPDPGQQMVKYGKDVKTASDNVAGLEKQEELLTRIVNSQIAGYASAGAEIKANTKALMEMAAAGLENTEFYQALLKDTAELKDRVGDLKEEIKALSSDTRQFDLLAGAITGLVSIAQVGASAYELFATDSAELQKSIQRLTALQNIAQGVQSLANELTTKGTALNKLYNFVIGEGAVVKEAETVATTINTTATEVNTAATEAAAVATEGLAIAQKVLRAALLASGIGLAIAAIVYLVGKLQEWKDADIELIKKQTELNQILLEQLRLNKEIADLTKTDIGTFTQNLKNKITYNQAYGRSQGELLDNELALIKAQQELSNPAFFKIGGFAGVEKAQIQLIAAKDALENFINEQKRLSDLDKEGVHDSGLLDKNRFEAKKALLQSDLDLQKDNFTSAKQLQDDFVNDNIAAEAKVTEIQRLQLDERRKKELENANRSANTVIDSNQKILDNERSTELQRIKALDNIAKAQQKSAIAANKNTQSDPSVSKNDKAIAAENLAAQLDKIDRDTLEAQRKVRDDYRKRDLASQNESAKAVIEAKQAELEVIKSDEDKSLVDRLGAAYDYLKAQEAIIIAERNLQEQTLGQTAEERQAIEDQTNTKILQARIQFTKDVNAITLASLEREGQIRLAGVTKNSDEELTALNNKLGQQEISVEQYNTEKLKIETKLGAESLAVQLENIDKIIAYNKALGKDTTAIEADIASKKKEISDQITGKLLENLQALRDKQVEFAGELTDLFQTFADADADREKTKIDQQLTDIDTRKERETDFANQTITDEQEKADAIATINAKAQRDKEVLAERQKKIDRDKAKTDKIVAVAKIVADTAQTVFKLTADVAAANAQAAILGSNPATIPFAGAAFAAAAYIGAQIPLVIGLGAIQAAKILATPAFRDGGLTPGGLVLAGDGFQKEYGVTPTGEIIETPAIPTIMNMPADTMIYPSKKALEESIHGDMMYTKGSSDAGYYFRYMTETVSGKLDTINKTIKNKKETHIKRTISGWDVMTKNDGNETDYLTGNLK